MFNRERLREFKTRSEPDETPGIVEPAFGSRLQALSFVLLVCAALVSPIVIDRTGLVTREQSYDMMGEHLGTYAFMKQEIFETSGDIDILFIGSSVLWNAVDTKEVQRSLSESLGREATVITLGFNFNGPDLSYTVLHDLLERRRVRMVVYSIPRLSFTEGPSTPAYRFLRYSENPQVVAGLPFSSKASLYACNVLRSPHDLLLMLRDDRSTRSRFADELGSNKELLGANREPANFVAFTPRQRIFSASESLYSAASQDRFAFTNELPSAHQDHYLKHTVRLLNEKQVPLAILNVPQYTERSNDKVVERFDWSRRYGADIPLIGVSPESLFAGLTPDEIDLLYCDLSHFNKNGNEFFTRAIMPALLTTYHEHASKNF